MNFLKVIYEAIEISKYANLSNSTENVLYECYLLVQISNNQVQISNKLFCFLIHLN